MGAAVIEASAWAIRLAIVAGVRERWAVTRRGRWKTVCAWALGVADPVLHRTARRLKGANVTLIGGTLILPALALASKLFVR